MEDSQLDYTHIQQLITAIDITITDLFTIYSEEKAAMSHALSSYCVIRVVKWSVSMGTIHTKVPNDSIVFADGRTARFT